MRRILLAILALSVSAFAQSGVRFGDSQPIRSTVTIPGVAGVIPVLVPNAVVTFCLPTDTNAPCTQKATTYTDATLTTPCSTSTQIVLAGTSSCVGSTDSTGAWGVWAPAGQYVFTVTANGSSSGPYPATLGGSSGGGGSSGAVVIAPATTQVLQGTAPGVQTVFKMPTGAGATFPGYEFVTSAWVDDATTPNEIIAQFKQNKQTVFGSGAAGTGISTSAYNNVIQCDVQTGADAGAKIAAATSLVSSGGVVDCRGLVGAQTIGSTLNLATANVKYIFSKSATFSIPTGVQINNSADDVEFDGGGATFDASSSTTGTTQVINFAGNRNYAHDFKFIGNRITKCGAGNTCRAGGGGVHGQTGIKLGTTGVINDSKIERVSVTNAGSIAISEDNCNRCKVLNNFITGSFSVAIQINHSGTTFNDTNGIEVAGNTIVNANVGCGVNIASPDNCGDGIINVISGGGVGLLGTVDVHDNYIDSAGSGWSGIPGDLGTGKSICSSTFTACVAGPDAGHQCGGGGANDTGCGQGIQSVYKSQHANINDNIIIHTSHEAIATAGDTVTSGNKMWDNSCCGSGAGAISYYIDAGNTLAAPININSISTTANLTTVTAASSLASLTLGNFVKIAGTTNYNTDNGTNPIAWQLVSINGSTATFFNPISTGAEATGTIKDVGLGHDAVISGNTCKDDGLCVSIQIGTNGGTNPDTGIIDGVTVSGNSCYGINATVPNCFRVINNCNICSSHNSIIKKLLFTGNVASGLVTNPFNQRSLSSFASGFGNFRSDNSPPWSTGRVIKLAQATVLTSRSVFTDSTTTSSLGAAQTWQICYELKTQTIGTGNLAASFAWTDENGNAKTHTGSNLDLTTLTAEAGRISECFQASANTSDILYSTAGTAAGGFKYDLKITTNQILQ